MLQRRFVTGRAPERRPPARLVRRSGSVAPIGNRLFRGLAIRMCGVGSLDFKFWTHIGNMKWSAAFTSLLLAFRWRRGSGVNAALPCRFTAGAGCQPAKQRTASPRYAKRANYGGGAAAGRIWADLSGALGQVVGRKRTKGSARRRWRRISGRHVAGPEKERNKQNT